MTGLSVLTRVPLLGRSGRTRHAFDEAFRALRTTLRFTTADDPISTIAVTSASEQEGKTTTSFQLAMATLEAGQSVLLVEADPFRPGAVGAHRVRARSRPARRSGRVCSSTCRGRRSSTT